MPQPPLCARRAARWHRWAPRLIDLRRHSGARPHEAENRTWCVAIKGRISLSSFAGPRNPGTSFAALPESAFGTKRTCRDDLLFVRFRGKADIGQRLPTNQDL